MAHRCSSEYRIFGDNLVRKLGITGQYASQINRTIAGLAGGVAATAGRSVIQGTDFGDNLQRALPSIIGNTIGNLVADGIVGSQGSAQRTSADDASAKASAAAAAASSAISIDSRQINLSPSDFTRLPAIFTADALAPLDTQAAANTATTSDQAAAATGAGGATAGAGGGGATGGNADAPEIVVTADPRLRISRNVMSDASFAQYLPQAQALDAARNAYEDKTGAHYSVELQKIDLANKINTAAAFNLDLGPSTAQLYGGFYNFFHRDIPNALNAIGHFIVQQVRNNDNPWVNSTAQPSLSIRQLLAQPLMNPNSNLVQDYMQSDGYGGAIIHTAPQGVSLTASAIAQWNQTETNNIQAAQFRDAIDKSYVTSNLVAVGAIAPQLGAALASQIGGGTALAQGISFLVGATSTAGFTYVTKGDSATTGDYLAGAVFGGLGGTGFQFINTGSRALNYVGNGAIYGGLTETTGQAYDTRFSNFDLTKIGFATGAGGLIGAAGDRLDLRIQGVNAGRNSWLSVDAGLNTRLQNGNIGSYAPVYSLYGGAGRAIITVPAAGINAAAIAAYPQQPNGK